MSPQDRSTRSFSEFIEEEAISHQTIIIWDMRETSGQLFSKYNLRRKVKVVDVVHVEDCIDNLNMLNDMDTVFYQASEAMTET